MSDPTPFLWVPGQGPDAAALERMARAFPKPRKPPGEAWFMGERKMFPELLGELDDLSGEQLDRSLSEIAIGPASFGQMTEWTEWYHYLLPRLLPRPWRNVVHDSVELLVTGFVTQHPDAAGDMPYAGFRADVLSTLGQFIMSPQLWTDEDDRVPDCFYKVRSPTGVCGWFRADGLMTASLFFCAKYLDAEQIRPWLESAAAISNTYWQAQLFTWLVGAHPILSGAIEQPAQFPEDWQFGVAWEWSHVLKGNYSGDFDEPIQRIPFLARDNRAAIIEVARGLETEEFFEELLTNPQLDQVAAETVGLPELFAQLYA